MLETTKADRPCQHPKSKKVIDARRDLISAMRRERQLERERLEESSWRKRSAAILAGRFRGADGFVDEAALDAYAPHMSERLPARAFTPEMEEAELEAWARIRTVERGDWADLATYRRHLADACRAYLRLVDATDRAARFGIKPLSFRDLRKPSLHSLKFGASRRWGMA